MNFCQQCDGAQMVGRGPPRGRLALGGDEGAGRVPQDPRAAEAAGGRDLMDIAWTFTWKYKAVIGSPRKMITFPGARVEGYEEGMEQNAKSAPVVLNYKSLQPIRK